MKHGNPETQPYHNLKHTEQINLKVHLCWSQSSLRYPLCWVPQDSILSQPEVRATFVSPRQLMPGSSTHIAQNSRRRPCGEANACAVWSTWRGATRIFQVPRLRRLMQFSTSQGVPYIETCCAYFSARLRFKNVQSCRKKNDPSLTDCRAYLLVKQRRLAKNSLFRCVRQHASHDTSKGCPP